MNHHNNLFYLNSKIFLGFLVSGGWFVLQVLCEHVIYNHQLHLHLYFNCELKEETKDITNTANNKNK